MSEYLSRYSYLVHIALGGMICLFTVYIFLSISPIGIRMLLFHLGWLGLLAFSEGTNAMLLLVLATAYLPSGFCGGLYTGYKIKENLRIIFVLPALIGLTGLIALRFFSGTFNLSYLNIQNEVLIPLLGNVVGAYLGVYTMNWRTEEARPSETLELDLSQVKS